MAPCRVAFVGAGYMTREHAKAFGALEGIELAGIHSRTSERAETVARECGITRTYGSIAELYDGTRADLVVVSVPELEMRRVATACAAYPWLLMLEKPPGYNLDDAGEIASAVRQSERRAIVALNRRFYASTRVALEDLAQDTGERFIKVQDQQDLDAARIAGQPETVVRNWMFANSIHLIDYFRMFGRGRVVDVTRPFPFSPQQPGVTICTVTFDSGDRGLYEGYWNAPGPWAINVTTRSRRWELRPLERAGYQPRGQRGLTAVDDDPVDTTFKPGLFAQAREAVLAAHGLPSRSVTLDDALETMRLVHELFVAGSLRH